MATGTKMPDKPNLRALAAQALDESKGDWAKAAKLFRKWAEADDDLWRAITEDKVDGAIWEIIRLAARNHRSAVWSSAPNPDASTKDGGLSRVAEHHYQSIVEKLMNFPLPGGLRLADATRPGLKVVMEMYAAQESAAGERREWLRLISHALPNDTTPVRKALTESKLRAFQDKARKAS